MRRIEKSLRVLVALLIILSNTKINRAYAASAVSFAGFENENVVMDVAAWELGENELSGGVVILTAAEASAQFILDLSSYSSSVDQGGLNIDFSVDSYIGDELEEELDIASVNIGFGSTVDSAESSVSLERGTSAQGTSITLTSTAAIPTGTRYLFLTVLSTRLGDTNTATFSNFSLTVHDEQVPSLSYSIDPLSWTNTDVEVTLTASDEDSGVEGIYDSEDAKVSTTSSYSFTATANGTWTFTARDYAGKTSDVLTVDVTTIDRDAPATPTLTVDTTDWTNASVGFTISEEAAGVSPESREFRLDGGSWQTYAEPATVSDEGSILLEARILDAAGNASEVVSETVNIDLTAPSISLTSTPHAQPLGGATIAATVSDALSSLAVTKYDAGSQTADYFTGGNGTEFSGTTFDVVSGGTYTVFAQDNAGNQSVSEITVNTYPSLDSIVDQTMSEDGVSTVNFAVSDYETSVGDLSVTASSSNTDLFPSVSVSNVDGTVSLELAPAANLNGSAVITVSVEDGGGLVTQQNFNVTVDASNDAPVAVADSVTTDEDTSVEIDALANDYDPDSSIEGDSITIVSTSGVEHGTANIINGGLGLEFIPAADWNGSTSFTYTIEDTHGAQASSTVSVTVTATSDAPVISDISDQTIDEDATTGALLFTVYDADGDTLTITAGSSNQSVVPDANITVLDLGSGNYTIEAVPLANANTWNSTLSADEPITITVNANDGTSSVLETFSVSVTAVNDAPVVVNDSATTDEGVAVIVSVLDNDSDVEGSDLQVTDVSAPSHGSTEISGAGQTVTYTPSGEYNGSDSFTYTVSDGSSTSTAIVNITVQSVNDAPVAENDTITINEDDTLVLIDALSNDSDVDIDTNGDHIVITDVTGQAHGTPVIAGDGLSLTYTPDSNWNGTETLTYTITDDGTLTDTATITITVNAVNDTPVASADSASTDEDTNVEIDVLANDYDIDTSYEGDSLSIVSVADLDIASVNIINSGTSLEFIPTTNLNDEEVFTYTIEDSHGVQSSNSVTVQVNAVNDAPVITPPSNQTVEEDNGTGALSFTATDVEGDSLTLSAFSSNEAVIPNANLSVTDLGDGNYTVEATPLSNTNTWNGTAHEPVIITLTADDGTVQPTATFTITINAVNDAPVVADDSTSTDEDTPVIVSVLANDSDIESDALTVSGVGSASHGSLEITGDGQTVTYTPVDDYNGSDSFTYTASDGNGGSTSATVSVTVNSVNDAPVAANDSVSLNEDIVTSISVLSNDSDVDITSNPGFETISILSVGDPSHGSAVISGDQIVYTPAGDYNGTDSFTYVVTDLDGATDTGTVSLTINPVNDYPTFVSLDSEYTIDEDGTATINFEIRDVETTIESLMLQVTSGETTKVPNSRLVLSGLGNSDPATTLTITPVANQNGDVVITLRLGDGFLVTVQTFTLHITPVNDAPVAKANTINYTEDESLVIDMDSLVTNDTDIDGDTLYFDSYDDSSLVGTLTVLDAGENTYTYTPPANYDQDTSFQYSVSDGTTTSSATVTLNAIPVNDAPTIVMDGGNPTSADEDNNITLAFTIQDQETDASSLTVVAGSSDTDIIAPANVTITCDASGNCSLVAQPNADKNGDVTLTISVSDGVYLIPTTVDLTFNAVDDAPNAVNDTFSVSSNGSQVISPLENDYDVDESTFSITSLDTTGILGSVVNNGDGTLTYTPPAHYDGTDSFSYTITDSTSLTDSATVTLTVGSVDSPPVVSNIVDQYTMEDTATGDLEFTVTDTDGDTITFTTDSTDTSIVPNDSSHIIVTEVSAGSGEYTVQLVPAENAFGTTTITLTASDGEITDSVSFLLTVYPVNDVPTAVTDEISTNEDIAVTFDPVTNDTDVESSLVIVGMSDPSHGYLSNSGTDYTYTPFSNYYGSDTMTYSVTDGASVVTGTINVTINSVNDAPVARNNWVTLENTVDANVLINVLNNDDSAGDSGETLSVYEIVTAPAYGTAVIEGNQVRYTRTSTPADSHDSFVYRIADDGSPNLYATATVYIAESWDPSINIENLYYERNEDAAAFTISFTVSDGVGDGWTLELLTASTLGTTDIPDVNGSTITYTPIANAYGSETLQYKVTSLSNSSITDTANIYITIHSVNDLPTITSVADQTIDEDTSTSELSVTIADVDDPVIDLEFAIYSGNQELVLNRDIVFNRVDGDITFTVTPIPNRNGTATISLLASDAVGYSTETFELTVNSINDAPNAMDYSKTLAEDTSKTFTVIPPYADVENDPLTLTITENPSHGSVVVNADDTLTYTPTANYNGADSFVYQLDDGNGGTDTGTVTLTITPVNDAPVISNLVYLHETSEDTPADVTFTISDIDNDVSSLLLSYESSNTTLVPLSALSLAGADGGKTLTVTPATNLSGESEVTITLSDGSLTTSQPFKLVVNSVNDLPVAVNDSTSTDEDTAVTTNVVTNDSDVEDASLTVASVTSPSHGSVVNNRDGTIKYTPTHNWNGTDSYTYTIVDSNNGSATATVTVVVNPVNDAPTAVTDTVNISEDGPVIISPMANDSDVEGDAISLVSFGTPAKGVLQDNGDGTLTYTPTYDIFGSDSFTYVITDGLLNTTGTVNINITAVNDAPRLTTSADLPWTLNEDTPTSFPINIYDPETDSDNLVIRITSSDQTILPDTSIELQGSGQDKTLLLTPSLNQFGTLDITIEATDGELTTTEVFPVLVQSVNDLPTISNVTDKTIAEDTTSPVYTFTVSDIETAAADLSVTAASSDTTLIPVDNITVTNVGNGNRTVQIATVPNLNGATVITLTVQDADGGTSSDTFSLTVTPVNDAPVANADSSGVDEDDSVVINVLANDTDVDLENEGDDLTIVSTANVDNGTVTIAADKKSLTFTPNENWNGTENFTYTIKDLAETTSSASVSVVVSPVNDAPVAVDDDDAGITTSEDHNLVIDVLANDTDIDLSREGDDLTVISTANVDHGSVTIAGDGKSIIYNPEADWVGTEVFDYTITDQNSATSSAQVTVVVTAVNDAPTISDIADQTIAEDSSTGAISFTVNDIDTDLASLELTATTGNGVVIPTSNITFGGSDNDRTVTITPLADKNTWNSLSSEHNPVLITVTVNDGEYPVSDSFYVTVTPVNDAPDAVNDGSIEVNEDQSVSISALANDTDVDIANEGDSIQIVSYAEVDNGTVVIAGDSQSLTYTPNHDWYGTEEFTYTIEDSNGASDTATITVTVNAVNDAPTIVPTEDQTIDEDTSTGAITFTINDVDNDVDSLTLTAASSNTAVIPNANIVLGGSGTSRTITITPATDKNTWNKNTLEDNPVTITITVEDATSSIEDTFTVTVNKINDAPVANDDTASVSEDGSISISVLTNDTDVDLANEGDDLTITSFANVDNGTVEIAADLKSLTFTPTGDWTGTEIFNYTITDLEGATSTAQVTVTVNEVNDPPTISDIPSQTIDEDGNTGAISFTIGDVDDNIEDLTLSAVTANGTIIPLSGIVFGGSGTDRTVTVTPSANRNTYVSGPVQITVTVTDTGALTASDSFQVTINEINDLPSAVNDTATIAEDTTGTIDVLANDTDVDLSNEGDSLIIFSVDGVDNGSVSIASDKKTLDFTPAANWNGTETFTYVMRDSAGEESTASVTVTVTAVNDPPLASSDTASVNEDNAVVVDVLANDTDVDLSREGDDLTIVSTAGVDNGAVTIAGDSKTLTFTPSANWNGSETFTYTIKDQSNATSTSSVTVTVNAINDVPAAVDDTFTIPEDQNTALDVLDNDTDVDLSFEGDNLIISAVTAADFGTAVISPDFKKVNYQPPENWYGDATFSYTMQDGSGIESSADVTVTVTAANDTPVAVADSASTTEDAAVVIDVLANDTDVDLSREGDDLTILSTNSVENGSVTIAGDGKSLTFTPAADWNGTEIFNYVVKDTANTQATATVTVVVSPVNDAPVAVDDSVTTAEDTSILVGVVANDTDVDLDHEGDDLTVTRTIGVDNGVTNISADLKSILFTPDLNWVGTEVFSYEITDEDGETSVANVTVQVTAVNDAPTAVDDAVTIDEDHSISVDVLTNDTDPDLTREGDNLVIHSVSGLDNGSVTIAGDSKSLTFTPSANWNGVEIFTYTLRDQGDIEATANVTITVNAVNDAPQAVDDSASTSEDASIVLDLLVNDTDVDLSREGDDLTIVSTASVDNGSTTIAADGKSLTFIPAANWNGVEEFSYTIHDQSAAESTANVTVTVVAVDDVSLAVADTASVNEEGSVSINVLDNDIVNPDLAPGSDDLLIVSVFGVDNGTVSIAADSLSLTFTPDADWNGSETFYYTMKDSTDYTSTAGVTVTIVPVNDPVTAVNDEVTINEDTAVTILALENDLDVDLDMGGDTLTITGLTGVDNGVAVISSGGSSIVFTPALNWVGEEIFTYTVEDQGHETSTADVKVTVLNVNDPPVISEIADQTISEDVASGAIAFTLTDADTPIGNVSLTIQSGNSEIIPVSNIALSGSGTDRTITLTPATNKNTSSTGAITITLTANDGTATDTETFTLTIVQRYDAPVAVADSTRMNEDDSITIDVLANDTDVDFANEGDTLTIVNVSGVDNASVQIVNSGTALKFTPAANWYGTEKFTYTIQDQGGLQSSAEATVVVDNMPEADMAPLTDAAFYFTSPKAGEKYKDGQTIHVSWTKANLTGVTYRLEFFDGVNWQTLASGYTNMWYDHKLDNTNLHTNSARYQVTTISSSPQELVALSEYFTIDNLPPSNVQVSLKTSDRSDYATGTWTNLPVDIVVSGGWDLTGITLQLYDNNVLLGSNDFLLGARVSTPGEHQVKVLAVDPLGNKTAVGVYGIKIDLEPPATPLITSIPTADALTGGTVTFKFSDDPGLSGNAILILPDGSEVPIDGDFTWDSVQDGVYTFVTVDLAGNRRTLVIAVTGGEMSVTDDSVDLPEIAPPDERITIDEATVQTTGSANIERSGFTLRSAGIAGCSLALLILLLILFWPNVKIVYTYRTKNGKLRKVVKRKRVFTPDDKQLEIKVKDAESYEITFSRGLTRSMRGGDLTIKPEHTNLSKSSTEVPDNAKDRFNSSFR